MMKAHTLLAFLCVCAGSPAAAEDPVLNLPIGDPARKDRTAPLVLDAITDTRNGELLTPREAAARLQDVRLLFVGESHTSADFHDAQLRILQELVRGGREVLIGLEMYPYTQQAWLDRWNSGALDEGAFVEQSAWYHNWGHHWNYYREIFLFARAAKSRLFAVNTPREVVSAVRKKGLQNLTHEEAAHLPPKIDTDNAEHKRLFKAFFTQDDGMHSSGMSEEQFQAMFRAQCTWDASMGYNAVQALRRNGGKDAIMVVLIGSGHVAYGLGVERQARVWFDGKIASMIPIPVRDAQDKPPTVRATYANFVWGLPRETDPVYPGLGLSTPEQKAGEYFNVIALAKESPAAKAGFQIGDELLSMDGVALTERSTLRRLVADKRWGDSADFQVRRNGEKLTLRVLFRRKDTREAERPKN
jgi:uncharacterized iron-regulated protein